MDTLHTKHLPLAALAIYHRNPRRGNVAAIAASLTKLGQYRPIVVNNGTKTGRRNEILAGNHTYLAARQLEWATIAAVVIDVDDDTAARINLADNRTADLGGYDDRILLELLADLPDLDGTGYDPGDLDALEKALAVEESPAMLTDPDDVPQRCHDTVTKPGDLWHLGPHRLAVGDATDPLVWDRLLGNDNADMMWTDPPYGVSYVGKTSDALRIENDDLEAEDLEALLRGVLGIALTSSREGAVWYVAAPAGPLSIHFATVLAELGVLRQNLIWVKDHFVLGRSDYHYRHEPIYYGWTPGSAHHRLPDRKQDTVFEVARPKASKDHPTMKPVELITKHIQNSSEPGQLVIDPFGGSGSTLIACHATGRHAALIELDLTYADVICRRYQEHTGVVPTREGAPHDFTTTVTR
ncbi:methyltransferase [Longimycelium tulufanense]|uniref:Methyltransferase n=1 Tax=Longimycelium tulufanense TaxID=907463 RepID=A0A8J3CD99_9PSEU|nr:DNA methyltransferase [Longimycelium tulufanense]GGM77085.1 methyltransferase [Longimycelium tulufanense]